MTTTVESAKPSAVALYLGDIAAAGIAGAAVTPVIAAVDRALAENASGKAKLWPSFFNSFREMGTGPIKFLRSPQFFWVWLTYGGTYCGVNMCRTTCTLTETDEAFPVWATSFCVNTTTCIMKDRAFARLFGTKSAGTVPLGSYCAWLGRDIISMAVFFTLPPIVGKQISDWTGNEKNGYYAAQIALPLLCQFVTTPIHLLGYDIYNNPGNSASQRIAFMGKDYFSNVGARMVRMAPPWSFGTIGNKTLRDKFQGNA